MRIIKNPIYKISAKSNFFEELALGIISKSQPNCKLKNKIVILPTNFACHSLKEVFKELELDCPIIKPINDLSSLCSKTIAAKPIDRIALVNKISNILLTMNIKGFSNIYATTELAEYFADLLNRLELYQINITELLQIIHEDLALHKQQISQLMVEFIQIWKGDYNLTRAGYTNLLIEDFTKNLGGKNVIIAGINSSVPSINNLIIKAAHLPNAQVILYGLDEHLSKADWDNVQKTHPQYNFKSLLHQLNISPSSLEPWHNFKTSSLFISQALRPAKSCDNWEQLGFLDSDNIKYLSYPDQHHEAKSIIKLIEAETTKSILIITNDDALMVKIMLHLKSSKLEASIIRDHPLAYCSTGIWLKLCLNFILEKASIISALALFKHKFSSINPTDLEKIIRDKNFFGNRIFDIKLLDESLNKFSQATQEVKEYGSFKDLLTSHLKFAETIANQDIWQDLAGEELQLYLEQLQEVSAGPLNISIKEYSLLFNHFLHSAYYREKPESKRITLSKPIDARLHSADIVILSGLNQGTWPNKAAVDPCFNSYMLEKIGLSSQIIGEEAYDFQCFCQAKEVILTRSEKINGSATTPSAWLLRLLVLSRNSIKASYELPYSAVAEKLTLIDHITPPLSYRPTKLSVTQIEKLIFNPYHIYVDLILKLKKLTPLNKELAALDFGRFIHKALEIYHHNRQDSFISAGNKALKELKLNQNSIKTLWWPRFIRIAEWFKAHENSEAKIFLENFGSIKLGDNFTMIAIADRLEFLSNSSVNIIDYKTGRLSSAKSIYSGKTLQLVLEAIIALNGGFNCQNQPSKINSLSYIQLSGGADPAEVLTIDITQTEIIEQAKQYLAELIAQYQDFSTPYYYSKKRSLGYCEYAHLARQ